ncbi:unnamed protein product [Rotaria sp. Silwood1]|nr:unnamed protein product [Rotaria sp. Silwood1]
MKAFVDYSAKYLPKNYMEITHHYINIANCQYTELQIDCFYKLLEIWENLLPHRASSRDVHRHVNTAPVRLRRAQNDDHGRHEYGHVAIATILYMKDLASIFDNDCVFYLSQDDRCKVSLGIFAAKIQASMLMHMNYRIRLPGQVWIVVPRHQLIPNVYAAYFDRLVSLKEFENVARDGTGQVKPIVIIIIDGGPDENPCFSKTLVASVKKFKKYSLDALFSLIHA